MVLGTSPSGTNSKCRCRVGQSPCGSGTCRPREYVQDFTFKISRKAFAPSLQVMSISDALHRFTYRGNVEWVMFMDTDE